MAAGIKPSNPCSPATLTIAMSDMTNLGRSVVVDLIMVCVIAMVLGTFLLIVTNGYHMTSSQLVWSMLILFTSFTMTGVIYRRLAN